MKNPSRNLILLTGTPITTPMDVYGLCNLTFPEAYKSEWQFKALHVAEQDFFGTPTAWKNEDLLQNNFMTNCARALRCEIDADQPEVTYEALEYELAPAHLELYNRLAREALLELEGMEEIDFLTSSALNSALQQVIVGYESYFEDPKQQEKARKSVAAFDLLDNEMEALGDGKLIVVAYYRKAIDALLRHGEKYNASAIYGAVSAARRDEIIEEFKNDPTKRLLIVQPTSGGSGLDGLQHVCSNMLFLELPMVARDFVQVVGRIDRKGQQERCRIVVACAARTLQVRRQRTLLDKDAQANKIQLTQKDLRDWLEGR